MASGAALALAGLALAAPSAEADVITFYSRLESASTANKCLGIYGGGTSNGTLAIQWSCNQNRDQYWFTESAGNTGGYLLKNLNGLCLEAPGWTNEPGAQLGQWSCHGGANQVWHISGEGYGGHRYQKTNSNLCISVEGGSPNNGARIIQWPCNNAADQYFKVGSIQVG
ncbi:RICIN domain-containing protein [Streptomyces goshikiensis]|uniref:RICIN domain-containing protein n=1 Tax=Streptomyces goshikiensis TaxID=1942 RepID=UPI00365257E8